MQAFFTRNRSISLFLPLLVAALVLLIAPAHGLAQNAPPQTGGEAHLILPDLSQATFIGLNGRTLLMGGLGICVLGLLFGLLTYNELRDLPVHQSMRDVSELIWETCKTYLFTQGKFLLILECFIGVDYPLLLRLFPAAGSEQSHRHSAVQRARYRGQLHRGVVRNPSQHVRQLALGVREPARQTLSLLSDSAAGGYEHRHGADLASSCSSCSASCCSSRRNTRDPASSASPSASRWARRRCASRAASSPKSRTSAPT